MAICGKRGIPPILCTLSVLLVSPRFAYSTLAQTATAQRSQAEINEEAQAAYKAGTTAAAKTSFHEQPAAAVLSFACEHLARCNT